MGSKRPRQYYCKCGARLANDNSGRQCARCERASRDKLITPPEVPPEFWQTDRFQEAFAAQHMGRVSRAYRTHPYHYAVYGRDGISQTLLGQWLGLRQPQVSRYETGPLQFLDILRHWAQVMRILQLGQADQAATLIGQGIAMDTDASFNRDRQYYLTYLAEARARPGKQRDLEASAALAKQSIDLAAGLDSTLNIGRIRSLTHQLTPHARVPAVREFLNRAQELATT